MLESLKKDKHWIEYPFGVIFYNKIIYFLKDYKIHPNVYTLFFIFFGILSGVLLLNGNLITSFIFWRISIILDLVDGPISRIQNKESNLGKYLDNLGHIFTGLAITLSGTYYASSKIEFALFAGLLFLIVHNLKYLRYLISGARTKILVSKSKNYQFIEKRIVDLLDIEILFILSMIPDIGFTIFILWKILKILLITYKSINNLI